MRTRFTPFIMRAAMTFSRATSCSEEPMRASLFSRSIGALTLLMMLLTTSTAWADTSWTSGGCTVTLSGTTLTVSKSANGNGAMADYSYTDQPWDSYKGTITTIVIGNGVTSIGNSAFRACNNANLTSVSIPSTVQTIGNMAFYGCKGLTSITIPASVTSIGLSAFYQCTSLVSITILGSGATSIGESAFGGCSAATTITIGNGVTTIGKYAFKDCGNSTTGMTVNIGSGVTNIDSDAFYGCNKLTSFDVDANNAIYASENGVLFNNTKTTLIHYPRGNAATSYTIPASVTSIGNCAFQEHTNLTSVTIPASVTSIGNYAFWFCTNLSQVTFEVGSQLMTIGYGAFSYCSNTNFTSITIPASVTSISNDAFANSSNLATVTVYAPSCTLGSHAFNNCSNSLQIYVFGDKVTYYNTNWSDYSSKISEIPNSGNCGATDHESDVKYVLTGTSPNYTLNIMKVGTTGAMADYANADDQPWKDYRAAITSVVIESGVTSVGKNAFADCSNLATVTFAAGSQLTSIGDFAFYRCENALNSITIPAGVKTIGTYAFFHCESLATVTFAAGSQLTTIGGNAFDTCTALTAFTVPASVTSIGGGVFTSCNSLASINVEDGNTLFASDGGVLFNKDKTTLIRYPSSNAATSYTIPASVTSIGDHAFQSSKHLTSVTISKDVKSIGKNAFSGCISLTTVTFAPNSRLEKIGVNAFELCYALTAFTVPASVTSIDNYAFRYCYNLASVTIYALKLSTYGYQAFDNNKSGRTIYVFKDCVDTYKSKWIDYSSDITAIPNLTVRAADDADVTKGKWCSYYNGLADVTVPAGTTVYTAKFNADKSRVNLTETGSQIIKKGEAVLLKSNANIELSSADDEGSGVYDDNELKGVDVATPQAAGKTYYVMSKLAGKDFGFYVLQAGTNLGANKAYLEVNSSSGAPEFVGFGKDEETSLTPCPSPKGEGSEYWYDLQGQKFCGKPTKKGVYVVNGQKVVIK